MSGSDWKRDTAIRIGFLFIASLVVFGLYNLTGEVERGENAYQAAEQKDAPAQQPPAPVQSRFYGNVDSVTCELIANINYRDGGYEPEDISRCDLQAQKAMARYTLGILMLTFAGLIVLIQTLNSAQKTLAEAEIATKAAIETAKVTREIGEEQARAYLSFEKVEVRLVVGQPFVELRVWLRNSGNSPARNVELEAGVLTNFRSNYEVDRYSSKGLVKPQFVRDVAPKQSQDYLFRIASSPFTIFENASPEDITSFVCEIFLTAEDIFGDWMDGYVHCSKGFYAEGDFHDGDFVVMETDSRSGPEYHRHRERS